MFEKYQTVNIKDTTALLADAVNENMTNYNLMDEKPGLDTLPKSGKEIWDKISDGENPIGHCYHRSIALVYGLSELDIDGETTPVFATIGYLSRGNAPEHVAGNYSDHFVTKVIDENGKIIWADSGRTLEEVQDAFTMKQIEFDLHPL